MILYFYILFLYHIDFRQMKMRPGEVGLPLLKLLVVLVVVENTFLDVQHSDLNNVMS